MPVVGFEGKTPVVGPGVFLASGALVLGDVRLDEGVSIWYRCVLRGDIHHIEIGTRSNLQDGVIIHVEHDLYPTILGQEVSVGHGAILHGCTLHSGCLIGMGSTILNGAEIGSGALIAAGSVVPPGHLAAGVPAVVKRPLEPAEILRVRQTAAHYVEYARRYLRAGLGEEIRT